MQLTDIYKQWCKETKRSGGVLVGSSIQEFLAYAQRVIDAPKTAQLNFTILTKEEVEAGRPKDAYDYLL